MSHVCAIYHIVISTYCRRMTICEEHKRDMFKYIFGVIRRYNCYLYRMNGYGNHIHILLHLHPSVALATLVQSIKQGSSRWGKNDGRFAMFEGWGKEYFAATLSYDQLPSVIAYIRNQEGHHAFVSLEEESRELCKADGMVWYDGIE